MPTIKDIAKEAGVSHGTVSNVLNKTGKVSINKIRLVEDAAKRLGYVLNSQAQLLRQGAANQIAVILPTLCDGSYRNLYISIQAVMLEAGFETLVYTTDDIATNEEMLLERLPLSNMAAAVSVTSLEDKSHMFYGALARPVVFVNRKQQADSDNLIDVLFDFYASGCAIGELVLKEGWGKIAYFCASGKHTDDGDLFEGIVDTLSNTSVSIQKFTSDTNLVINKAFDIFCENQPFDVIVTANRMRADAVSTAAQFYGHAIKPVIITVGTAQTFPDPHVKTYELDYGQMGMGIAEMLIEYLRDGKKLPASTMIEAKGFSFSFPQIHKQSKQNLTMLTVESPSTAALYRLIPLFEELTGVTVKITAMTYEDLYAHIGLLGEKVSYDLVRMDTAWLPSLGSHIYLPLDEAGITQEVSTKNLINTSQGNYSISNGILCALPFDPSVQILLYRSDLFNDAILQRVFYEKYREPLKVPCTITQFARVAEFFTRSYNPDSPTLYGATLTSGSASTAACDFLPYYLSNGHTICDEHGCVKINTPDMIGALKQYATMKPYANMQENLWWRDTVRQFAEGSTATAITFSNYASYIINSKRSNVVGKTGTAVLPGQHPLLGGGVLGVCRYSRNVESCQQFFKWFYTKDIASALVRLGGTSPLVDAYNTYDNFSIFPWLSIARESFTIGVRGVSNPSAPAFSNIHFEHALGTSVRNMLNQTMTAEEAAEFAQAMYDSKDRQNS